MIYFNYLLVVIPHQNKWYKYLFRIWHYCSQYNSFILFKLLPCHILDWNSCSNNERPTKAHLKGALIQSVVVVQVRKALAEFTEQHHQKCHWHISLREHNHPHKCWCRHLLVCSYAHSLTLRSLPLSPQAIPPTSFEHSDVTAGGNRERELEWQSITDDSVAKGAASWCEETPLSRPQAQKWERRMETEAEQRGAQQTDVKQTRRNRGTEIM